MEFLFISGALIIIYVIGIIFFKQNSKSEKLWLQNEINILRNDKIALELKLSEFSSLLGEETKSRYDAENKVKILDIQLLELKNRFEEWEKLKNQALEHAKSVVFEVGGKLSIDLLERHKKENDDSRKKSYEEMEQVTKKISQEFLHVMQSFSALNMQVKESKETIDMVKEALLSPGGAGALAEITLENILMHSGLIRGVDYLLQHTVISEIDGNRFRPDAIVFLPGNNIMIIDSKASKFFLEQNMQDKMIHSMRSHLKSLSSKDYQDSVRSSLKKSSKSFEIRNMSTIMFLPTETAVERLQEADREFMEKAWKNNIYPSGPIGLVNVLSNARFQISEYKQEQNYQTIIDEVGSILSSIAVLYEYARKLGLSLQSASSNFDKFAASFNSNMLYKAKKLSKLGVQLKNNKNLPKMLDRYQMVLSDNVNFIDLEAEDESNLILEKVDE